MGFVKTNAEGNSRRKRLTEDQKIWGSATRHITGEWELAATRPDNLQVITTAVSRHEHPSSLGGKSCGFAQCVPLTAQRLISPSAIRPSDN